MNILSESLWKFFHLLYEIIEAIIENSFCFTVDIFYLSSIHSKENMRSISNVHSFLINQTLHYDINRCDILKNCCCGEISFEHFVGLQKIDFSIENNRWCLEFLNCFYHHCEGWCISTANMSPHRLI